ncbi:MAG: hypothetical protein MUD14_03315 [Hydrococcus sp. Prado102]|jgi:hypothetical protein|nr:hypothetical protein [Hydrococcus sp. Prado102]
MTFINTKELGLYAPKTNEKVKLAQEAQKYITEAIFTYKQLFYGLRLVAWRCRDKRATFYEALSSGELDQFKVAPGHRAEDGSYTKSEWDYDRLNAYMWNRFRERFDAAFNLEQLQELKNLKDIRKATDELLEFALTNWGEALLGANLLKEVTANEPIAKGVTRCQLNYQNIRIVGKFGSSERTISLTTPGVPEVIIHQTIGTTSWKGGIHFNLEAQSVKMNSQKAQAFGQMLELASRLNLGIKEFMANPENFLGIESAKAHQCNLQLVKEKLLLINQDYYEKRQAEAPEQQASRRINETIDATEAIYEEIEESENEHHPLNTPPQQESLKQRREREAAEWLAKHGSEFGEDIDTQLGLNMIDIDAKKLDCSASKELPL